ncbi:MAG: calcium-binding protein [Microcoleaceae cyanobacterium]
MTVIALPVSPGGYVIPGTVQIDPRADLILVGEGEFVGDDDSLDYVTDDGLFKLIYGKGGNDSVTNYGLGSVNFNGNQGDDTFTGSIGDDTFLGGLGKDIGQGGLGNDLLIGGLGDDTAIGGDGNDTFEGSEGVGDIDYSYGGDGNDVFFGGLSNEFMFGDSGNDNLLGGKGSDFLSGGNGYDVLIGGIVGEPPEVDRSSGTLFTGDGEPDVFVISVNFGLDRIVDFEDGIDKLGLQFDPAVEALGLDSGLSPDELLISRYGNTFNFDFSLSNGEMVTVNPTGLNPDDIIISIALTSQILAVISSAVGGDGITPVLTPDQITSEDFISTSQRR